MAAEFNFHADPEAAARVLAAFGARAELVPWEATLACPLPWVWAERGLLALLLGRYRRLAAADDADLVLCDLLAAALALDPTLAAARRVLGARVALSGEARGALLLDWYGRHALVPVTLVERLDAPRLLDMCRPLTEL